MSNTRKNSQKAGTLRGEVCFWWVSLSYLVYFLEEVLRAIGVENCVALLSDDKRERTSGSGYFRSNRAYRHARASNEIFLDPEPATVGDCYWASEL